MGTTRITWLDLHTIPLMLSVKQSLEAVNTSFLIHLYNSTKESKPGLLTIMCTL